MENSAQSADEGIRANCGEMMYGHSARKRGAIIHVDMPAEHCAVCDNDPAPQMAIVRDVRACHEVAPVTDRGDSRVFGGSPIDSDRLAKNVVVSNHNFRWFAPITDVLRFSANDDSRVEVVFATNGYLAHDGNVVCQSRSLADSRLRSDDAKRADLNIGGDLSAGVDARVG